MKYFTMALRAGLLVCMGFSVLAEDYHIKPLQIVPDINNVDLLSGKYYPSLPVLSIPAAPRLTFETLQQFDSKITGTLYSSTYLNGVEMSERRETYSLTYGSKVSEHFTCLSYDCVPADNTGSTMLGNMSQRQFTYRQGGTGMRVRYTLQSSFFDYSADPYAAKKAEGTWYASEIFFADGESLTISYDTTTLNAVTYHRPTLVTSNTGYQLKLTYKSNDIHTGSWGWSNPATVMIVKTSQPTVVLAKHTYANSNPANITDLLNRTWQYTGFSPAGGDPDTSKNFTMKLPSDSVNTTAVSSATRSYAGVSHNNFVTSASHNGQAYYYAYVAKSGTGYDPRRQFSQVTITGPASYKRVVDLAVRGAPSPRSWVVADTNSAGKTTRYTYTPEHLGMRLETVTYPEGNSEKYTYDAMGNVTSRRLIGKPGAGEADKLIKASYSIFDCTGLTCFRPTSYTDANSNTTELSYDAAHGNLLTKLEPADANGERRLTTHTYQRINGLYRLMATSVCAGAACGTVNEQITRYTYWGNTHLPLTVTQTNGTGSLSQTTTYSYDNAGRMLSEDGPLAGSNDASYYRYDAAGRKTWEIGPLNQAGVRVAKRMTYRNQDEQLLKTETGTVTSPTSTSLSVKLTSHYTYNTHGLPVQTHTVAGAVVQQVTQTSYDARNRVMCSAKRMNPTTFTSLPTSACTLADAGLFGPDRITHHSYDVLSQLTQTLSGYGTDIQGVDIALSYTANGQVYTRKDGNGNITTYAYDGFDRLERTTFPDGSYEQNSYDANDNLLSWRKRDGKTLTHSYDGTNIRTSTTIPGESTLNFEHDGLGRQSKVSRTGHTVTYGYDGLGRLAHSTTNGRKVSYGYDNANRRTALTHPDGFYVNYSYDSTGALSGITEKGTTALVSYSYDGLGRLTGISRGNNISSVLGYDGLNRLKQYDHGSLNRASFDYNPASQLTSRVVSNSNFQIQVPTAATHNYSVNTLNQYTNVAGKALTHDSNGNLKSYDGWSYSYNAHNRLTGASKTGTSLSLDYDATGRLYSSTVNGSKTLFLYDGDELIAEYNSAGTLLRRYVHGVGTDDPLVWYEGSTLTNKRDLLADERGSVIAQTSPTGSLLATHKYGPYGEQVDISTARFRYTGQILIPGTELYHYKARVYHPRLGRFMQTDPIGYQDGMNWYAYGGNDPVNKIDPTGNYVETLWDVASLSMGVVSLKNNASAGNWGAAAVDVGGIVLDGLATAAPLVPGGASMAITASRQGADFIATADGAVVHNSTSGVRESLEGAGMNGTSVTNKAGTESGTIHNVPDMKMDVRVMDGGPNHTPRVVTSREGSSQAVNPADGSNFGNVPKAEQRARSHIQIEKKK